MAHQTFHLVGIGGTRKTTLAVALAQFLTRGSNPKSCVLIAEGFAQWFDVERGGFIWPEGAEEPIADAIARADVAFIEHHPDLFTGAQPDELVIRTSFEAVRKGDGFPNVWDGCPRVESWLGEMKELQALSEARQS